MAKTPFPRQFGLFHNGLNAILSVPSLPQSRLKLFFQSQFGVSMSAKLNLFQLHDPHEDMTPKRYICTKLTSKLNSLIKDMIDGLEARGLTKQEIARKWAEKLDTQVKSRAVGCWMQRQYKVPLCALKALIELWGLELHKEPDAVKGKENEVLDSLELFSSTISSDVVRLPAEISPKLLYYVGIIIGDGSLPNTMLWNGTPKYTIYLGLTDEDLIRNVASLDEELFEKRPYSSCRIREGKKPLWELYVNSKPIFRFLNKLMQIPKGKKSHVVRMPGIVRRLKPSDRAPFIAGLFDAEGSHQHDRPELATASHALLKDITSTIQEIDKSIVFKYRQIIVGGKVVAYAASVSKHHLPSLVKILGPYSKKLKGK